MGEGSCYLLKFVVNRGVHHPPNTGLTVNTFLTSKKSTTVKIKAGMIVALAVLTTTSQPLASEQRPSGVPLDEARSVVNGLALQAQGHTPGLLNLRFVFAENATPDEKLMWQSLVMEIFFATQATRINIQLSNNKKGYYWIESTKLDELTEVFRKVNAEKVEVAIYNMPTPGEYRLVPVQS